MTEDNNRQGPAGGSYAGSIPRCVVGLVFGWAGGFQQAWEEKRFKEAVWMENDLRKPWKGTNESMNVGVYYSDYLHVGTY